MIFCHYNNLLFNHPGMYGMYGAFPCGNPFSGSNMFRNLVLGFTAGLMQNLFTPRCFNPFMMNSDALLYSFPSINQNIGLFRYSDYTIPMPSFNSVFLPNNQYDSCGNFTFFNNFGFNFNNMTTGFDTFNFGNTNAFNISPAAKTSVTGVSNVTASDSGEEVKDGTPITVTGVDYGVFGKDAQQIRQLRPEMQKKVELLYKYAKNEKHFNITLCSGYRSTEKQRQLYNAYLARGKKPPVVAEPGTSRHEFGCAVDLKIDGDSRSPKLKQLTEYANKIGLRQGLSFGEPWHFDIDPRKTPKGKKAGSTST